MCLSAPVDLGAWFPRVDWSASSPPLRPAPRGARHRARWKVVPKHGVTSKGPKALLLRVQQQVFLDGGSILQSSSILDSDGGVPP